MESRSFDSDRLNRRQLRYLITKANATTIVAERAGHLLGYVTVLFSRGTSLARLYSIAVSEEARGQGLGKALVRHAEKVAADHDCAYLRLEIRTDNQPSIRLFESQGYKRFGSYADYYEDHADAHRYEKSLAPQRKSNVAKVPYYEQTLEFTCGPAALMMAMKRLNPKLVLDRKLELRLWREATTIFMTSGHGGCGPFGLAIAAATRGFHVEVYVNDAGTHLVDSVRSTEKKEVIRLVQEDMADQLRDLAVEVNYEAMDVNQLEARFRAGQIPLVLISSYQIYEEKYPHWVTVTGFDERFIYVHDPYVDYETGETLTDSLHMPIHKKDFARMSRYGRSGLKAVVLIGPARSGKQRKRQHG